MKHKILEDYLKIIYILSLDKKKIENEDIALILETEQSIVKKNLEELIKRGYINYENYEFKLTDKGLEVAKNVYKRHELFEDVFKKILKIGHQVAHIYSDVLEHISNHATDKRLEHILRHYDYWKRIVPLTFLKKGDKARLVRIDGGYGITHRLSELGLCGNCMIEVLESSSHIGPVKIKVRGSELMIGYGQAKRILVEPEGEVKEYWRKTLKGWAKKEKKAFRKKGKKYL
ncbi:MAG: DtxR family transcriptional regulator [Promethearchaeota archaeon]